MLLAFAGCRTSFQIELPLSVLYIAWALKKSGVDVEIIDLRVDDPSKIKSGDYLFAGVSSMTGSALREGLKFSRHMKELNPQLPVVWGGVHVSLLPEQSINNQNIDIIVRGEGELTVQELAMALKNGSDLAAVKGITYKKDGKVFTNSDREFMNMNLIDAELPYELLDMKRYANEVFPVHTSRGCPYRCGFCYNLAFNKRKWRAKTADKVLDEIEYVVNKFGAKGISFTSEDEFFIDVPRVREICEGLISRGIKVEWHSFCRYNSFKKIDAELLDLIQKAGCKSLSLGAESGSKRILDEVIQKDIKIEDVIEATEKLKNSDIMQIVSFMSGLPTETDEDMEMSFKLIDRLAEINPKNIYINGLVLYTPYPGTPLFDDIVKKYKYKIPDSIEGWADIGIYRETGITWHKKSYLKKYKMVSILSRFPFWKKEFGIKDIEKAVLGGSRFTRFPYNVMYLMMTRDAMFRWKHRFFKLGFEWALLEKILESSRGYV